MICSSCFCPVVRRAFSPAPVSGITLQDKQADDQIVAAVRGRPFMRSTRVRKAPSSVKGGQLAGATAARVASDDSLRRHRERPRYDWLRAHCAWIQRMGGLGDCRAVWGRQNYSGICSASAQDGMRHRAPGGHLNPAPRYFAASTTFSSGDNQAAVDAVANGYYPTTRAYARWFCPRHFTGEARGTRQNVRRHGSRDGAAWTSHPRPCCIIAGEPTVTIRGNGRGSSPEFALTAAPEIAGIA